jgi:hypothetical protein
MHTTYGFKPGPAVPENSEFHPAVIAFARCGHILQRQYRADDGRVTFVVTRLGHARMFSDWHSVQAFLTQVGERA